MSLADILSLRDSGLSEQEAWAVCLECSLSVRSVARSAIFQTLCITPDTLAFNTSGNVCFMELLSGEARGTAGGRVPDAAVGVNVSTDQQLTLGPPWARRSQSPGFCGDLAAPAARGHWGARGGGRSGARLWAGAGLWSLQPWLDWEGPWGLHPPFLPFRVHSHTAGVAEAPLLTMAPLSPKMALTVQGRAGGRPLGVQGRECPPLAGPRRP